uniref:Putative pectate lyase n=1 Tax=viral metagenome TaxID=1070528 RepID=A0A6M3IYG0_9ZZZZ
MATTMYPAKINSPMTLLSAAITAAATTVPVDDADLLPDAPNVATIGRGENCETIYYGAKDGNNLTSVTRGFQGTAAAWVLGESVYRAYTAYDHDTFKSNIEMMLPIGATAYVISANAPTEVKTYGTFLRSLGYNVWVCDGTADNVQIQEALDAAGDAGGGIVHLTVGIYLINTCLKIPHYVTLEGEGFGTIIKLADDSINNSITDKWTRGAVIAPKGAWFSGFITHYTTYGFQIRDLKVDANMAGQTGLTDYDLYGIYCSWSNNERIDNVWVINAYSSGIAIWPSNPAGETYIHGEAIITRCRIENCNGAGSWAGHAGIFVSNGTALPIRVIVSDCMSFGNNIGFAVEDSAGGVLFNNCIGAENTSYGLSFSTQGQATVNGGFFYLNGIDGICVIGAGERFNTLNGVTCFWNGRYGAYLRHDFAVTGGQFINNDDAGIVLDEAYNNVISGAVITGNGASGDATYPYGIYIVRGLLPNQTTITGCFFGNDYYAYRVADCQTYGIYESGECSDVYGISIYTGNTFAVYGSTQIPFHRGASSISIIRNNAGYVTENSGTATLLNANTSVVVAHGCAATPTFISITWAENPTNVIADWWVDTIGATNFTLNGVDPGASNLTFMWKAEVR